MIDLDVVAEDVVYEVTCKSDRAPAASQISYSGLARLLTAHPCWRCWTEAGPGGIIIAHVTKVEAVIRESPSMPVPALV